MNKHPDTYQESVWNNTKLCSILHISFANKKPSFMCWARILKNYSMLDTLTLSWPNLNITVQSVRIIYEEGQVNC